MQKIQIVNKSNFPLPEYKTKDSAGVDLHANLDVAGFTLKPLERKLVPTGIYIALMEGFEAQVRPRSGMALKKGVSVLNAPGTIDADYRGEIGVILVNLSNEEVYIENGERVAQLVIAKYTQADWEEVESLTETVRGVGGFGSTGF